MDMPCSHFNSTIDDGAKNDTCIKEVCCISMEKDAAWSCWKKLRLYSAIDYDNINGKCLFRNYGIMGKKLWIIEYL